MDIDLSLIEPSLPIGTKESLHRRLMQAKEDNSDLARLVGHGHTTLERFLAKHPLSPAGLLRIIYMQAADLPARRYAISHQNADEHIRVSAQNSRVDADRVALARGWSGSDQRVVIALENDRAAVVRVAVASHRPLHDELAAVSAVRRESRNEVLQGLAQNPSIHPSALAILGKSGDVVIRVLVACHPGTPVDTIQVLTSDSNAEVAAAAREELQERQLK